MRKFALLLTCLLLCGVHVVFAQSRTITGTVTDSDDGSTLPGVSVVVKGTSIGTVTDIDGKYSLSVAKDAKTLRFSFVGFATQEIEIGSSSSVSVEMKKAAFSVDEVVVTAFGISKAKKALGYASTEVASEEMLQKSENDMLRALDGKVAGVEIRSTGGAPGSATRITIRGNSSFSGDNQPLFVVDGIPYSNDFVSTTSMSTSGGAYGSGIGTLDPNDIESTSVLKGAAAAALYGSRAKNGVVLITTKSGSARAKKFSITLNSSVNFETISSLPDYQNTYGTGSSMGYSNANGSWGSRFDSRDSIPTWPGYSAAFGWGKKIPYVPQPDNVSSLFKTGVSFDNSVNVAGSNDQSSYNLTISDSRNDGYIPYSKFNRTSISVGGNIKLWKKLTAGASVSYSATDQVGGIFGNNQSSDGYGASSFARALYLGRTWIMDPYENPLTGAPMQPNGAQFDNPLWSWKHNQVITGMDRISGNVNLKLDITSWLNLTYKYGFNSFIQDRSEIIDIGSRAPMFGGNGGITEDMFQSTELESQLFLNFDKEIISGLSIDGLIGLNHNQRETNRQAYRGFGFIVEGIYDIDNTEDVVAIGGGYSKRRLAGLLGEVTVNYKDYAFLTLRGRNDWSSTLPKANNSYFYPAIDASFIFTEAFGIESDILSFGKVRASWGKVGMDADPYMVYDIYELGGPFMGQSYMYTPDVSYDPNLTPEYKEDFEVGAELNFFKNRLNFDVALYNSNSTDQIYPIIVPASSGYSQTYTNVGALNNKGIEISVMAKPVDTKKIDWDMRLTFTKNINKVVSINGVDSLAYIDQLFGDPSSALIVGQPYGVLYGTATARDNEGNLLIDPSTGFMIQDDELQVVGDPNPKFMAGLTNTITAYGFTFSFLIDLKYGGDIYSNTVSTLLGRGVTQDTEDREKTHIIPGVYGDATTLEPILDANGQKIQNTTQVTTNDLYFCSGFSTFAINSFAEWNIYDATTLRLREVSLGYTLPESWIKKSPFSQINLSVTARNLWFYTPFIPEHTNFDPEVSTYGATNVLGVEYDAAPSTRRIGFNIKLVF
ncbi:MAG: SusC/RagA family TonB-linked outer membrane protein [Prolixibacteraceae bacterium]|nr:SusC/RagA family TonB-linked outer membrane protein [Prolixibacteraceae bacterium]